jgi:small subunit ribosomal protein S17
MSETPSSATPARNVRALVVSDKQDKTIVVRIERRTTHPLYGKT